MKDKGQVGAFAQASARSSAAVPFFNVYSVLILSFSPQVDEEGHLLPASHGMEAVKKACINVAKNPLILGILAGLPGQRPQLHRRHCHTHCPAGSRRVLLRQ